MPKFKPVDATDLSAVVAQDASKAAVFGDLIGAVQSLVGALVHARGP
jgi:hypothetical protein